MRESIYPWKMPLMTKMEVKKRRSSPIDPQTRFL